MIKKMLIATAVSVAMMGCEEKESIPLVEQEVTPEELEKKAKDKAAKMDKAKKPAMAEDPEEKMTPEELAAKDKKEATAQITSKNIEAEAEALLREIESDTDEE